MPGKLRAKPLQSLRAACKGDGSVQLGVGEVNRSSTDINGKLKGYIFHVASNCVGDRLS